MVIQMLSNDDLSDKTYNQMKTLNILIIEEYFQANLIIRNQQLLTK